jgi:glycosyltransferase involved in cell wall biosynthesis
MRWIFWGSAAFLAYTYLGYAGWLWLRSRYRRRPVHAAEYTPSVSIVMVVRNEAAVLERKLKNLLELDYPQESSEIVVISDGSTDATNQILAYYSADRRVRVILNPESRGKAAGLNDAIAIARGEIVVFTDARQKTEASAVRLLARNFADSAVGCASGELMLGDPDSGEVVRGVGLYWRIEKYIREMESASGSVVHRRALCGATEPAGAGAGGNDSRRRLHPHACGAATPAGDLCSRCPRLGRCRPGRRTRVFAKSQDAQRQLSTGAACPVAAGSLEPSAL